MGSTSKEFSIEDLFPVDFYMDLVKKAYSKELAVAAAQSVLGSHGQTCKRAEQTMQSNGIKFNKGRVAKLLRRTLSEMKDASTLPVETKQMGTKLIAATNAALPELEK